MSASEDALTFLQAAERDLRALEGMIDDSVFAIEVFGFHGQQAAEKALKPWLSCAGQPVPKVHDLDLLLELLGDAGEKEAARFEHLSDFTEFAVEFRYGAYNGNEAGLDRAAIASQVRSLVEFVRARLEGSG